MKKNIIKKIKTIIIFTILLLCFIAVCERMREVTSDVYMKLALFPTSTLEESYYFVIKKDGTFVSLVGRRKNDNIKSNGFMAGIGKIKEIELSEKEFQEISKLLKEVKKDPPKKDWFGGSGVVWDSWYVTLRYNGKNYKTNYWGEGMSESLNRLIDKIVELSPLEVDIHGWA